MRIVTFYANLPARWKPWGARAIRPGPLRLPGQTADLVIRRDNFGQLADLQAAGDWDGLGRQLAAVDFALGD